MTRLAYGVVLLWTVACVPSSRRVLILDLALADPALVEGTATPWQDAGYRVAYRPAFPHLTRADLAHYGVVILLGGRGPTPATDGIDTGDLAALTEWVPRGGVLVFGYAGDGEGSQDRWVMNRWLDAMGTGIGIGDHVLHDTAGTVGPSLEPRPPAHVMRGGPLRLPGVGEFPAGRDHALRLGDERSALARTTATAFVRLPRGPAQPHGDAAVVAACRVGAGLVVVASRHLLSALGPEIRPSVRSPVGHDSLGATRTFLVSLARWTRRPAEWAHVPTAHGGRPLALVGAPRPLATRPLRRAAPTAATITTFPLPTVAAESTTALPGWLRRSGLRVAYADTPLASSGATLGAMLEFLDAGGFNILTTPLPAAALSDTAAPGRSGRGATRPSWREALDGLAPTSLRWFPLLSLEAMRRPDEGDAPRCFLDDAVWTDGVRPALRAVAALARERPDVVGGVAIDLSLGGDAAAGLVCTVNAAVALPTLGRDAAWAARLLAVSPAARFDSLLDAGLLTAYATALEREVAARAANARAEAHRIFPGLLFAARSPAPPGDWRSLGLLRGFGAPEAPVLLWTLEPDPRPLLAHWRARGIHVVTAIGLAVDQMPVRAWGRLPGAVYAANRGFWVGPVERLLDARGDGGGRAAADSLARRLRRLANDR